MLPRPDARLSVAAADDVARCANAVRRSVTENVVALLFATGDRCAKVGHRVRQGPAAYLTSLARLLFAPSRRSEQSVNRG